ncbi:P-loop containing nucleoside triphosphate hydrolase protein [Mycena vulgaris]|nr:P-loop containing nucleoside triphosphate hydrolase protein [Mycena vulgaris]
MLTVISPSVLVPQAPPRINNCPPPTRIFHGRQTILDKINRYFMQSKGVQKIFLLYGLGGAGKTQIALKFIQELASHFTDIFLIDTSTVETIDAGLKTIATVKNVGSSSQDALQWLRSKEDDWLLFFDNSDDPKINLNDYFPQCTHGNILITSRNPGLRVYAASHSHVSDMEETDAMDLLLRSAALDITDHNKLTATRIVKVLCYLPLAIIQAGAFISQSGNLDSYLDLYEQNRTRLLSQKPTQGHDSYAWTVYTTWQISFDQLSQNAQRFLQLCSFLHYQGISEEIFKNATNFEFKPSGPSQEELQMPLEFLSQFLGPSRIWDSFCFMDLTNEIQSYSLINYDSEKKMFSIHPLVHYWTRGTLSNEKLYHHCMIAIVGMGLARLPDEDMKLACLWMLPHIELLIKLSLDVTPDIRLQSGKIYMFAGKTEKANQLALTLVDYRRELLGDDHPDTLEAICLLAQTYNELGQFTNAEKLLMRRKILSDSHPETLHAMANLAVTYHRLGKLQTAEELQIVVLDMRRKILGNSHPDTLLAMANLAVTYTDLGKLQEAEELEGMVLDMRRKILGNSHPETLRAMANLAVTYHNLGKLQDAEELKVVVLEMQRNILGDNHRLGEAEELLVVAFEKQMELLGNNHPETVKTMKNLRVTYEKLGKFKEEEDLKKILDESQT